MNRLDRSQWETLLDRVNEPRTYSEVVDEVKAAEMIDGAAEEIVETAIDAGDLVEDADAGIWGEIRVPDGGSDRSNPGSEPGEPTSSDNEIDHDNNRGSNDTKTIGSREPSVSSWFDIDFTTEPDTYPPALLKREQWMGQLSGKKLPFAPWGDRNPPVECNASGCDADRADDLECDCDGRFKWGYEGHYLDGEKIAMAEEDNRLDGRVFIQTEADPFVFVDGDDVRDPETGEVHPAFLAILNHLGMTYGDVSTSGGGIHAQYRGELPGDLPEAKWELDTEPFGSHDDLPAIEIYANKHVNITTGEHLLGTGTEIREWNVEALEAILKANDQLRERPSTDRGDYDLDGYEPTATESEETTDEIRDVFAAIDRLDPKRVGERTIVQEWTHGERSFLPVWGNSDDNGTANYIDDRIWHDTGHDGGYGGPVVMAAIDADLIDHRGASPQDVRGETFFKAVDHLRELGFSIPTLDRSAGEGEETDYRTDPRTLEATVDPKRAWEAAGRVTPGDVESLNAAPDDPDRFECPVTGDPIDVVRAVALQEALIDEPSEPLGDTYPQAYALAREDYGAPLPEYYTTADAIAEFDAVLDVIAELTFWDLDEAALNSEITGEGDDVDGEAVRTLAPVWRDSESGESVLVFESGIVWDADTERTIDMCRFAALDSGIISDPYDSLSGPDFTDAYATTRVEYGAPLPRWEPASDGEQASSAQLPPSEDLLEARDLVGVDADALDEARSSVEKLIGEATEHTGDPTIITALPATGKTTGTVKTAADRPLSYLAPRKELQAQALTKADRWGVDARVLPVFSEKRVRDEVLSAAVASVRERGKQRLRDRWAILSDAIDASEDDIEPDNIFESDDEDGKEGEDVSLDRATCDTAEGAHGVAWALAVHVAYQLGHTPREIHQDDVGLFGAEIPCSCSDDHTCSDDHACEYSKEWEHVADPDDPADLLVGSYGHAHVDSVRSVFERDRDDQINSRPRPIVLDEFPGEAFTREFGDHFEDHATWLARSLRNDVEDRRDLLEADLDDDELVEAWLRGEAGDVNTVDTVLADLAGAADLIEARENAAEIVEEVEEGALDHIGARRALEGILGDEGVLTSHERLVGAIDERDPRGRLSGLLRWVQEAVFDPLDRATNGGEREPGIDQSALDELSIGGDLRRLVEDAIEAITDGRDDAEPTARAAIAALRGGREGCRRLAAWADDGYAHPDAHHLLEAIVTPTDRADASRLSTSEWAFDPEATDGTVLDRVETWGTATTIVDRNGHGARIHSPPPRTDASGAPIPLIGLDATARGELWSVAIGEDVRLDDIHTTKRERQEFLEDALQLRVIRAADRPRFYEGDPTTKDTDGDVALLEALAEEYSGVEAPRKRGEAAREIGRPAAITTKGVREVLENDPRLDDVVGEWDNYGNVKGSNELRHERLAAILGCQHYGDHAIERFAALAGEEVDTDRSRGRGATLEYGSETANAYLKHMTEDQTMQAILRFARGDSGATVVARTSALRDDLPVVGQAQVLETYSETATAIAREYRRLGRRFTAADVRNVVDVTPRQVRRVLGELVDAGYLTRKEGEPGRAHEYERIDDPGAGEVDLPERPSIVAEPRHDTTKEYYTWNVRVRRGDPPVTRTDAVPRSITARAPPAPGSVKGLEPPS